MFRKPRHQIHFSKIHFPSITFFPLLLIGLGWYIVNAQKQGLVSSTVKTYQAAQLEAVRSTARTASAYASNALAQHPDRIEQVQQEVIEKFIQPAHSGEADHAWLYTSDTTEHPQLAALDLNLFKLEQLDAAHWQGSGPIDRHAATAMLEAIRQGREGTSLYLKPASQVTPASAWWHFVSVPDGEVSAWTPLEISLGADSSETWVIGTSALLTELMQRNGAYAQMQNASVIMGGMTLLLLALLLRLRHSKLALETNEAYYRAIVEDQTELICRFRNDGTLTFANQAYADLLGTTVEKLLGSNLFDWMNEEERSAALKQLARLTPEQPVMLYERRVMLPHQLPRWYQWTDRAIVNSRGQILEIQAVGRDITDRKTYESEIERLAFTDPLTGLANRRRLYDNGEARLQQLSVQPLSVQPLSVQPQSIALLYLDLDRFKPVNDSLGHDAGDELLLQVAMRLRACVRKDDTLARVGGDEFAILLSQGNAQEAQAIAERVLNLLHQPFHLRGQTIHIGSSLGITTTTKADTPFSDLLTQADLAMYQAKLRQRGSYAIFDSEMYAKERDRLELEVDLRQALQHQQFRIFYQPIVSLATHCTLGFEALVRWQHPTRGLLTPASFLPIAAEMGLGLAIERWVLREACRQMVHWQQQYAQPWLRIHVNLSAKHLIQPDLLPFIQQTLSETQLAPKQLNLEITEDAVLKQTEQAISSLQKLHDLGIYLSLDDFGTGYSSLSYLHCFPVDVLKIDRAFVSRASSDRQSSAIVRTILTLAESLGMETIAEGIETIDQLAYLQSLHCSSGQGLLFSEPLEPAAVAQLFCGASDTATCRSSPRSLQAPASSF